MNYYEKLKSQTDILEIAQELGFEPRYEGRIAQGECPGHPSSKGKCLTIYNSTQSFYCFHCNQGGDVIDLVRLFKDWDHQDAVNFLADRVGIPRLAASKLAAEAKTSLEAEYNEIQLVYDMLTEAAIWFHKQLDNYPEIKEHLINTYKFSEKIIEELKIGFAPPTNSTQKSILADHLKKNPRFQKKLLLSGLFIPFLPNRVIDYFQGRIMFPYWSYGKVVFFKGRATKLTPVNTYECYSLGDGAHPAEYIKYKALRVHDPNDEKRKYISKVIKGDVFLGQIGGSSKKVVITEGVPDWVSAIDHGFQAISPGATNFKKEALDKLAHRLRDKSVYLIFDNDANEAGQKAALELGKVLMEQGILAYIVDLPKAPEADKVDLNEYLRNHSASELSILMDEAKLVVYKYMEKIPKDKSQSIEYIKSDICPLLVNLEGSQLSLIIEELSKRTKISQRVLKEVIDGEIKHLKDKNASKNKQTDPEIIKQAQALAHDPLVFKKRLDVVNQLGVVGERNVIAMYFAALDSRLLTGDNGDIDTLSVKNQGHFGSGKSYSLMKTLKVYPESCYHLITNGSPKSMYYLSGGMSHKALVVAEGFQFQTKNAEDSELVYTVRTLLSEGAISYLVPEKDREGKIITKEIKLDGPTSFITTTVMEKLEPQLEDRLFTVHSNESPEHTSKIIKAIAAKAAGDVSSPDNRTILIWKEYHKLLQPVKVIIPFAKDIAEFILKNGDTVLAARRAFNRLISVIKAVTCAYQYQRVKKNNAIVAEMQDYYMALQIVLQAFKENLGHMSETTKQRLKFFAGPKPVKMDKFMKKFKISKSAASQWISKQVKDGELVWCKENGELFADEKEIKMQKSIGKAYLKRTNATEEDILFSLPTPYDLTNDQDWSPGGKLFKQYDLELGQSSKAEIPSAEEETMKNTVESYSDSDHFPFTCSKPVMQVISIDDKNLSNDNFYDDPSSNSNNDELDLIF